MNEPVYLKRVTDLQAIVFLMLFKFGRRCKQGRVVWRRGQVLKGVPFRGFVAVASVPNFPLGLGVSVSPWK